jgi:hypothetical protein
MSPASRKSRHFYPFRPSYHQHDKNNKFSLNSVRTAMRCGCAFQNCCFIILMMHHRITDSHGSSSSSALGLWTGQLLIPVCHVLCVYYHKSDVFVTIVLCAHIWPFANKRNEGTKCMHWFWFVIEFARAEWRQLILDLFMYSIANAIFVYVPYPHR